MNYTSNFGLLSTNALGNIVSGILPPLIAIWIGNVMSLQSLASLMVASAVIGFFFTPILAPFVEACHPLKLCVRIEAICLILCIWIAFRLHQHAIEYSDWMLYFVCTSIAQSMLAPAYYKISAKIVSADDMVAFNSWESAVFYVARMGGPIIAGFAMLVWQVENILTFTLLFPSVYAAIAFFYLNKQHGHLFLTSEIKPRSGLDAKARYNAWWTDIKEGFVIRWKIPTERFLALQVFLELLVIIPTFGIVLPAVVLALRLESSWLGWFEAACGAGLVLGSLCAPKFLRVFKPWSLGLLAAGLLSVGVLACGIFVYLPQPPFLAIALVMANFCLALRIQAGAAQRRVAIPPHLRVRFASIHMAINTAAAQIGIASAALFLADYSPDVWLMLCSVVLLALAAMLPFIPGYKILINQSVAEAEGHYSRTYSFVNKEIK